MQERSKIAFWILIVAMVVLPSCGGYINNPQPALLSINPASVTAGQPGFTLEVIGKNFSPASFIEFTINGNATPLVTVFTNVNQMSAQITPAQIQTPGTIQVSVFTQQPGGGTSQSIPFTINPSVSPVPSIKSISPTQVPAGNNGFTLVVTGTGFVSGSAITVNGRELFTNFGNSTSISAAIPPNVLTAAGTLEIGVINPQPGGGSSNSMPLTIVNPIPVITAISPTSAQAGTAPPALAVTGTGFVNSSVIEINGAQRPTTFTSSTSVSTQLTAADLANGGVDQIQVVNQTPRGASNILPFSVNPTASAGLPVLVDVATDGSQANNGICGGLGNCTNGTLGLTVTTSGPSASQTGSLVAFASVSTNLITNNTNPSSGIFLRNTCLGTSSCQVTTTELSTDPNGGPANGASSEPSLDSGGAHVAFTSTATNLVTNSLNGVTRQIFWRPTCSTSTTCATTTTDATQLVSVAADGSGSGGNADSFNPVISPDGRYVAFVSLATNLVSNVTPDGVTPQIYVRDTCDGVASATCAPVTILVSTPDGSTTGNGRSSQPAIADATQVFVTFSSTATNLGSSAPNPNGEQEVFERSACPNSTTACATTTILISSFDGVAPANGPSIEPTISGDGRFVAFASVATNIIPGDGPTQQIYVRDTCTGQVTACVPSTKLVSTPTAGNGSTPGNAPSEHPSINQSSAAVTGTTTTTPTVVDGQVIAFASTASNLSANAANGVENIYVRNMCEGIATTSTTPCTPSTILASQPAGPGSLPANGDSLVPAIAANGHAVTFLSFASNLVLRDDNNLEDIFIASTTF